MAVDIGGRRSSQQCKQRWNTKIKCENAILNTTPWTTNEVRSLTIMNSYCFIVCGVIAHSDVITLKLLFLTHS